MKGLLNKRDKETVWYENEAPVNEYLDKEYSRKANNQRTDSQPEKLSWLDIIKKSWPVK